MNPISLCFVTGSRAEYDRLVIFLKALSHDPKIHLSIIATGAHLSAKFGMTVHQIERDGFRIVAKIKTQPSSSEKESVTKSIGIGTIGLAKTLTKLRPDGVIIFGDRAELLSVATATTCLKIPLIHLCGGEITEGAIDDQVRHMLTKAAHLHFAANRVFANRILQMGEESWRVAVSGSPALDMLKNLKFISKQNLDKDLQLNLSKPTALVTYHPPTLETLSIKKQMQQFLGALAKAPLQYVITYPNADADSDLIIQKLKEFSAQEPTRIRLVKSLGNLRFLSSLRHMRMMIGNSSSGIVEAPSFNLPVVNIGERQQGRVFGKNVIQSDYTTQSILSGIKHALKYKGHISTNPYGDGRATPRIVRQIKTVFSQRSRTEILHKKFINY